ncbi:Glutathione-regulated potassium-efflux system protein KefC [Sporomusa silvacetica DSM 10669]|uniref:Glutathione-regulated potassium-efflux system protein KefC n=1 Tax=Sporomusa silvacetica DSM 10669 TaxID=1123289 RepID=A0ABZ3ITE6_9FIRM|nr:potassium channel protein [Sporomusa silvacetica]OZC15440.1 voltage-gated potassium channel Kch [Sporomusa silvacetica DSM 10669]
MYLDRLKVSLIFFIGILIVGIIGFMALENLSFYDATYLAVVTIATVGFGDIVPKTSAGRMFTCLFIIIGVGMAYYTFTLVISMSIEGRLKDFFGRKGMNRRIASLDNHIIVCGAGKVGGNVIQRLQDERQAFVVIEKDLELYEQLCEEKVLTIHGDATLDEILLQAGVKRAKGLITALSHDADNVYVTLTGKSLNPEMTIVARADRAEAEEKLRRAGATTVIFPSVMGGRQMVSAMIKPVIMDFVENLFYNQELHMDIAEVTVQPASPLVGKNFIENDIKGRFNSIVVAIKRDNKLITNPPGTQVIIAGDIMIVLGQRTTLSELNELALAK